MIRVSNGPIRISTLTDDRWGRVVKYWSVNHWGWVSLDRYNDLLFYESKPEQNELMHIGLFENATTEIARLEIAMKNRLERLHSRNVVYQFNANGPKLDYMRMCAVLCNDRDDKIQRVSWFDAYVKFPVYLTICKIANKFIPNAVRAG